MVKSVSVHIVTYFSESCIQECIEAVLKQTYPIVKVLVLDNASGDRTLEVIGRFHDRIDIVHSSVNTGFAAAHNQLIRSTDSQYVLVLNPDVVLDENYVKNLMEDMELHPQAGSATGKLLFAAKRDYVDSAGLMIRKNRRAFDRGAQQLSEHFSECSDVFGVSGAAALYSRSMIDEISLDKEFFDEDFFAYKEDVDVAWRAQCLGWKARFVPAAYAFHERGWKQGGRSGQPLWLRKHSYINRYYMIVKNDRWSHVLRHLPQILLYEAMSFGFALVMEPKLLAAWGTFWRKLPSMLRKRRWVQHQREDNLNVYQYFD